MWLGKAAACRYVCVMTEMSRTATFEDPNADRPMRPAILKGWRRKCPNCGKGDLLEGYLTVRQNCPECGEPLHHQRADDGPAWLTIVVAGKIMAPLMLFVWETWQPEPMVMATTLSAFFVGLSLYLLPRFKGIFVNIQWSRRMHGFGGVPDLPNRP